MAADGPGFEHEDPDAIFINRNYVGKASIKQPEYTGPEKVEQSLPYIEGNSNLLPS
jgi:hypothetical protein